MNADHLLAEFAAQGIEIIRDGDALRIRAARTVDLTDATLRIQENKPALHEALLKREIMAVVHGPTDTFDRAQFNALFAEWTARYGVPWEDKTTEPTASPLTRSVSTQNGA